jgi:hypothetical protein
MGKSESKHKIENKVTISSRIQRDFICPLCNKKFTGNMTYQQLNQHLYRCGNINSKDGESMNCKLRKDFSFNNLEIKNLSETNRDKNKFNFRIGIKEQKIENLKLSNGKNKYANSRIINSNYILDENPVNLNENNNDNNANKNLMEEYFIKNPQPLEGTFEERYNNLKEYFELKKKQMNQSVTINAENLKKLLFKIKDCNLYLKSTFLIDEEKNKFSLNDMVIKYFELMIEKKKIGIINGKSIAISLKSKLDFELLGYILAILIIYDDCKIKYKLPQLLCKLLIKEKLSLNDMQYENKDLYDNLIKIKNENDLSELDDIYFICEGYDLIIDGSKIKVDENNIEEYIDKMINYEILKYKKEITLMQDSVFQFVPKNYIINFTGEELYRIMNKFV